MQRKVMKALSCLLVLGVLMSTVPSSTLAEEESIPTRIFLEDDIFEWHTNQSLVARLVDQTDTPLGGKEVWFYQEVPSGWLELGYSVTSEKGIAEYDFFVVEEDGQYFFKAVFNGDENYLSSTDTATITIVGDIAWAPVIVWGVMLLGAIASFVLPILYMKDLDLASERLENYRQDIIMDYEEWKKRAEGAPETGYPDEYKRAEGLKNFYEIYSLVTVSGDTFQWKLDQPEGGDPHIYYKDRKNIEDDLKLGLALVNTGKSWWNDTTKSKEERKRGAQMYVKGAELVSVMILKLKDYVEIKKLCEVPGDVFNLDVDFHINVIPGKGNFNPSEMIIGTIRVTSNRNKKTDIWLKINFRDENGVIYEVPANSITPDPNGVEIAPNTIKKFTVKWPIPDSAPKGPYEIAIDCWRTSTYTEKYTDDFEWKTLFYIPEFHITHIPEKTWYKPGEKVIATIDVENLGEDRHVWFDATWMDSQMNLYHPDVTPNPDNILIPDGETRTFTIEWTIPQEAPLGEYTLFINCYKEASSPGICPPAYSDDFDSKKAFNCYSLDITSLTNSDFGPIIVGDPNSPREFCVRVSTGIPFDLDIPGIFSAKIGDKRAEVMVVTSLFDRVRGSHILKITPPQQDNEGEYDLEIRMDLGHGLEDTDTEQNAIIYSTGGNVDIVLVIDRSGSMGGSEIRAAKDSAKDFVNSMSINDMVGIVSYSSSARVDYGLTKITSDAVRQDAEDAIDAISAGGMTSIGAGLRAAYNEIVSKGDPSHPHAIILMSDGWQNTSPHPNSVLPDIRNANIRVFTIGLGPGADANLLSHIAHKSGAGGGEYYYSPSSEELRAIYGAIAGIVRAESIVKTVTGSIEEGETIIHKVNIDSTVDKTTFTATWTSGTLRLELMRPDNSEVDPNDPGVFHTKRETFETYTISNPMVGEWTMKIIATGRSRSAEMTALAEAGRGDNWSTEIDVVNGVKSALEALSQTGISYSISVKATTNLTMNMYTDKDQYSLNEPMKIIAALSKAGDPITGADVKATIEKPGAKEYLLLYDDGLHNDGIALDGVYANYYTNANSSGSYTVTIHASGTASAEKFTREVKKSLYVSSVPASEISVASTLWDAGVMKPGMDTASGFTVSSTSAKDELVAISATDLVDTQGNVIRSDNVISIPSTFAVPAGGSHMFYGIIYVPESAEAGNYAGSFVITSTANSVSISVTLQVESPPEPPEPPEPSLLQDASGENPPISSMQICPLAHHNIQIAENMLQEVQGLLDQLYDQNLNTSEVEELVARAQGLLDIARAFCSNGQNCIAGNILALEAQRLLKEAKEMLESMLE